MNNSDWIKFTPAALRAATEPLLARIAELERELEALKASIGEPVAATRSDGTGWWVDWFRSMPNLGYDVNLYAIKEVK